MILISPHAGILSFVIVPGFLADHPFDEAVKDARYIVHTASPLASAIPEGGDPHGNEHFVRPSVSHARYFEARQKEPSVQRIVIISPVASLIPPDYWTNPEKYPDLVISAECRHRYTPQIWKTNLTKYGASETAALVEAEDLIRTQKPTFDAIHIYPTFISGREALTETFSDFFNLVRIVSL